MPDSLQFSMYKLDKDPAFQKLSMKAQNEVRAEIAGDYFSKDPGFLKLEPAVQAEVFQTVVGAGPSLKDKRTQLAFNDLIARAQKGDNAAKSQMNLMVGAHALIGGSIIVNTFGTKIIAPMIADQKNVEDTKTLEGSEFWSADPLDRAKMAEYSEYLLSDDAKYSWQSKWLKIAGGVLPAMAEILAMTLLTAGTSSAPIALGKIATASSRTLAAKATVKGSQWGFALAKMLGSAQHAAVTAGVGLVRENTMSLLEGATQTMGGKELVKNNAKWFGGYFLGDVVGNIVLDNIWPMMKGAKMMFLPKQMGQNAAAFRGVDKDLLTKIIKEYLDGNDIDPYLLNRLPEASKQAFVNMKISRAVLNNLPDASEEDIFTMLSVKSGYIVSQSIDGSKAFALRSVGLPDPFIKFKDTKAGMAWLVNDYGTAGKQRVIKNVVDMGTTDDPKFTYRGKPVDASQLSGKFTTPPTVNNYLHKVVEFDPNMKLADYAYDGVPLSPANFTRQGFRNFSASISTGDQRVPAINSFAPDHFKTKYGFDPNTQPMEFVQSVLKRHGFDPKEVDVILDSGTAGEKGFLANAGDYSYHKAHTPIQPGAKWFVDFTALKGKQGHYINDPEWSSTNAFGMLVEHEIEHVKDYAHGWRHLDDTAGRSWMKEPHHARYSIFDLDWTHRQHVKMAIENGYKYPTLELEYEDLLPYSMRPNKVAAVDLPTYTGAAERVEIRQVLMDKFPKGDKNVFDKLAKLASPEPSTGLFQREKLEGFVREYLKISGAPDEIVRSARVFFRHSDAVIKQGPSQNYNMLAGDNKKLIVSVPDGVNNVPVEFEMFVDSKIGAALAKGNLDELVKGLDRLNVYPLKSTGRKAAVDIKPSTEKFSLGIETGTSGERNLYAMVDPKSKMRFHTNKILLGELTKQGEVWNYNDQLYGSLKEVRKVANEQMKSMFYDVYAGGGKRGVILTSDNKNLLEISGISGGMTRYDAGSLTALYEKTFTTTKVVPAMKTVSQKGFMKKFPELLERQKIFSEPWVAYAAEKTYGAKPVLDAATGQYQVGKSTFSSYEALAHSMIANTVDEDYLAVYLAESGSKLRKNKTTGFFEVVSNDKPDVVLYTDATVKDLLLKNPELMPKIPSDLGPQITVVTNGGLKYSSSGVLSGKVSDILGELSKFDHAGSRMLKKTLAVTKQGYLISDTASKQFEVYIPSIGERMYFNTLDEAKAYLKGGWESLENLEQSALAKGMRLKPENGKWVIWNSDKTAMVFDDLDGVKKHLASAPKPSWMPELSGLDSLLVEPFKKILGGGQFPPHTFEIRPPRTPTGVKLDSFSQFVSSPEGWLIRHISKGGDQELLKTFRTVENLRQLVRAEDNRIGQIAHTIFKDSNGKQIPTARRKFIGEWLIAKGDANKAKIAQVRGLSDDELAAGRLVRQMYGEKAGEGLHGRYTAGMGTGIGFLEDYLPILNKHFLSHKTAQYSDGSMGKFLRESFGGNAPRELDAFFLHQRTSDMLTLLDEDDPLALLLKYSKVGNRKMIMGSYWDEAIKVLDNSEDAIGKSRMFAYMADVMGLPQGSAENILKNASLEALRKFGVDKGIGSDLLRTMMSFGYMSALGARPMLAVRNMMQIWTTLAPSLGADGNHWVNLALKKIAADKTGQIFDGLRAKGIMMANLPVPGGEMLEFLGAEHPVGKVLNAGMKWYRNSDELSRAVAYWAARMKFDNAGGAFRKSLAGANNMTEDAFVKMSGLEATDPEFFNATMDLVRKGDWISAADKYAVAMADWTMFPYRAGMSPMSFRGVVGKLFGMMGHYPVYYIENIRRNLRFGSTATKLAFATTFAANSAALYGAFTMAGLKADDFLPWKPLQFVGGPYYQLMNGVVQSFGPGYKGRQARAEMLGITTVDGKLQLHPEKGSLYKWFIPFAYEGQSLIEAAKLADEGKTWAAFLSATGGRPTPYWTGE